jgi:hypothetical protein
MCVHNQPTIALLLLLLFQSNAAAAYYACVTWHPALRPVLLLSQA